MAVCATSAAAIMLLGGCGSEVSTAGHDAGLPDSAAAANSANSANSASAAGDGGTGGGGTGGSAGVAGTASPTADPTGAADGSAAPPQAVDSASPTTPGDPAGGAFAYGFAKAGTAAEDMVESQAVAAFLAKNPSYTVCDPKPPVDASGTHAQLVYLVELEGALPLDSFVVAQSAQVVCDPAIPNSAMAIHTGPIYPIPVSPKARFDVEGSQADVMVWATYPQFEQLAKLRHGYGPFGWDNSFFELELDASGEVAEIAAVDQL